MVVVTCIAPLRLDLLVVLERVLVQEGVNFVRLHCKVLPVEFVGGAELGVALARKERRVRAEVVRFWLVWVV